MDWLIALFLGAVEGLVEFLPISSSAHLTIVNRWLDLGQGFELFVLLHLGALGALLWHCRRILIEISRQILKGDLRLFLQILVGTLPAGLLGLFAFEFVRNLEGNILLLAIMVGAVGLLMLLPTPVAKQSEIKNLEWKTALGVGGLQALALIPGVSRSGITILTGLHLGMERQLALLWSFLLAIPLLAGAGIRVMISDQGMNYLTDNLLMVVVGNLTALVVGLLAIKGLLAIVGKYGLKPFGFYRLGLSALLLTLSVL